MASLFISLITPLLLQNLLSTTDFAVPFKYKSDSNISSTQNPSVDPFFHRRKSQIFTMAYKALHDLMPIASLTSVHSISDIWAFLLFPKHARHVSTEVEFPLCEIPLPRLSICFNFLTCFKSLLLHHFVN